MTTINTTSHPDLPVSSEGVWRPASIDDISLQVAQAFVDLFGGEETDMTIEFIPDGHSGSGFYAWCTEYPEDGSDFLGPASEFSSRAAISQATRSEPST